MSVKIGIAPGNWAWSNGGESFFEFVDQCEAQAWDSIWLSDRLVSDQMNLEPVTALAAVAGRTRALKFGTSVIALAIRNPALLAKELATVDYLSGGRFLPAVGLGGDDEREYEAAGVQKSERGARTDEAIGLIRRLWTEDAVTHHGRFYHLTNVTVRPRPVFKPLPPMWIGGRTPAAWRRVAAVGDGWLTSSVTPEEAREGVAAIKSDLSHNGRTIDDDHYGIILPAYLAGSVQEAQERSVRARRSRPDIPFEAYAALGAAQDIRSRLGEYVDAGVTKFVLRLACPEPEWPQQMRAMSDLFVASVNRSGTL